MSTLIDQVLHCSDFIATLPAASDLSLKSSAWFNQLPAQLAYFLPPYTKYNYFRTELAFPAMREFWILISVVYHQFHSLKKKTDCTILMLGVIKLLLSSSSPSMPSHLLTLFFQLLYAFPIFLLLCFTHASNASETSLIGEVINLQWLIFLIHHFCSQNKFVWGTVCESCNGKGKW